MKTRYSLFVRWVLGPAAILCVFVPCLHGAGVAAPALLEYGPHHRVWASAIEVPSGSGTVWHTNTYKELSTGLYHWTQEGWSETRIDLEILGDVVVARHGPHKVLFPASTLGEIDIETPDSKRLRSRVLGLSYFDTATAQSVLFAELQEATAELYPPNSIFYPGAFDSLSGSLRYFYTRHGLEQDVILHERPPSPAAFGLNPATTRLEVFTEFEAPEPSIQSRPYQDFVDHVIGFGLMSILGGKAFALDSDPDKERAVRIAANWLTIQGRVFCVETIAYSLIEPELNLLPPANGQAALRKPSAGRFACLAVPRNRQAAAKPEHRIQMAKAPVRGPAYVLDYQLLQSGSSLTLTGSQTFWVSGPVVVTNLVIEGGAVVKFTNANSASIEVINSVQCDTGPYKPALLTALDDHTVGAQIGSGTLSGYYADTALKLPGITNTLSHVRISHAKKAISQSGGELVLRHSQVTHCIQGAVVPSAVATLENVLFYAVSNVVSGNSLTARAAHLTVNRSSYFSDDPSSNGSIALTNSILLNVTNLGNSAFTTNSVLRTTDASTFVQAGAGHHYLANNQWRGIGSTNLSADLTSELRDRTTHAPMVINGTLSLDQVWSPAVARGIGQPDLGFYYAALDAAVRNVLITNATLLLTNGAAVATYGPNGFLVTDHGQLISEGGPLRPNILTRYYCVQEQTTNWGGGGVVNDTTINPFNYGVSRPSIRLRFTESTIPSSGGYHVYEYYSGPSDWRVSRLEIKDSVLYGGLMTLVDTNSAILGLTNNLIEEVYLDSLDQGFQLHAYNNLLRNVSGVAWYGGDPNGTMIYKDNLLDQSGYENLDEFLVHQYNAFYLSIWFYTNYPPHSSEQVLSSLSYQTGRLGRFYYPTNSSLIDTGSRFATNAGLFHYTCTTNQVREGTNQVDRGMHYVALDLSTGRPKDDDADSLYDFAEDRNGNGVYDAGSGETDWKTYDSMLGIGPGPGLVVFTLLK